MKASKARELSELNKHYDAERESILDSIEAAALKGKTYIILEHTLSEKNIILFTELGYTIKQPFYQDYRGHSFFEFGKLEWK
jgi:hypothetical protein